MDFKPISGSRSRTCYKRKCIIYTTRSAHTTNCKEEEKENIIIFIEKILWHNILNWTPKKQTSRAHAFLNVKCTRARSLSLQLNRFLFFFFSTHADLRRATQTCFFVRSAETYFRFYNLKYKFRFLFYWQRSRCRVASLRCILKCKLFNF